MNSTNSSDSTEEPGQAQAKSRGKTRGRIHKLKRCILMVSCLAMLALGLFVWNGTDSSWKTPESGQTSHAAAEVGAPELRLLAWNVAKALLLRGFPSLAPAEEVNARLDAMAAFIKETKADVVFLSEVIWEAGWRDANQVTRLAKTAGYHAYAYNDNYRFGLPFFRARAGNAILSRYPLEALETLQLPHGTPFYEPTNNRRALISKIQFGKDSLLFASIRNDSFRINKNAEQVRYLLDWINDRPIFVGGDFNADPHTQSMKLWKSSNLFSGKFDGPPTKPDQDRRIDYILAPKSWQLISEEVLKSDLSDHLPVLAVFRKR